MDASNEVLGRILPAPIVPGIFSYENIIDAMQTSQKDIHNVCELSHSVCDVIHKSNIEYLVDDLMREDWLIPPNTIDKNVHSLLH